MDTIRDAVEKHFKMRCLYGRKYYFQRKIIEGILDFVLSTMEKEKHNVGMILHTGSACFDVLLIVCAALSNILYNQTATDDVIASLTPGDKVLYYSGKENKSAKIYILRFC